MKIFDEFETAGSSGETEIISETSRAFESTLKDIFRELAKRSHGQVDDQSFMAWFDLYQQQVRRIIAIRPELLKHYQSEPARALSEIEQELYGWNKGLDQAA